jgi:hypothetical protein
MALTRRQRSALPYLVSGLTVEEAARQSKVPAATLRRWMDDPEFQDVLEGALKQSLRDAINLASGVRLAAALDKAIARAVKIVDGRSDRNAIQAGRLLWEIANRRDSQNLKLPQHE